MGNIYSDRIKYLVEEFQDEGPNKYLDDQREPSLDLLEQTVDFPATNAERELLLLLSETLINREDTCSYHSQSIEGDYEDFNRHTAAVLQEQVTFGEPVVKLTKTELGCLLHVLHSVSGNPDWDSMAENEEIEGEELIEKLEANQPALKLLEARVEEAHEAHTGQDLISWFC